MFNPDKLKDVVKKYREKKANSDTTSDEIVASIADMLFSPKFQDLLKHSTPQEIDNNVQAFLA